jgi:hypothetical protein
MAIDETELLSGLRISGRLGWALRLRRTLRSENLRGRTRSVFLVEVGGHVRVLPKQLDSSRRDVAATLGPGDRRRRCRAASFVRRRYSLSALRVRWRSGAGRGRTGECAGCGRRTSPVDSADLLFGEAATDGALGRVSHRLSWVWKTRRSLERRLNGNLQTDLQTNARKPRGYCPS